MLYVAEHMSGALVLHHNPVNFPGVVPTAPSAWDAWDCAWQSSTMADPVRAVHQDPRLYDPSTYYHQDQPGVAMRPTTVKALSEWVNRHPEVRAYRRDLAIQEQSWWYKPYTYRKSPGALVTVG